MVSVYAGIVDAEAVAKLRQQLSIPDGVDDEMLAAIGIATWERFGKECKRRLIGVSETRYFTARSPYSLALGTRGDLLSVTSLATDADGDRTYEAVWATTDYDLEPANAALDLVPYSRLCVAPNGRYSFPAGVPRGVQIAGTFGYFAEIDGDIEQAWLDQCGMVFRAKDAPLGMAGGGEFLSQVQHIGLHPFTARILEPIALPGAY